MVHNSIIIDLWKLLQIIDWWFSAAITIVISILLTLQPDANCICYSNDNVVME